MDPKEMRKKNNIQKVQSTNKNEGKQSPELKEEQSQFIFNSSSTSSSQKATG